MAEESELIVEEELATEEQAKEVDSEPQETLEEANPDEAVELDIVLEGEEPEVTPQNAVVRRLQNKRDRLTAKNDDLATQNLELQQRLEALESNTSTVAEVGLPPDPDDFDTRSEWQQEMLKHQQQVANSEYERRNGQNVQTVNRQQAEAKVTKQLDDHYARADELIQKHNIKNYDDAESKVADILGEDALKHAISLAGKDSAKLILYWGRNESKLAGFKSDMDNGKYANIGEIGADIGRICGGLTLKPKRSNNAPEPASTVEGNTSPAMTQSERKWRDKYEAAARGSDRQLYRQLQSEGKERGFSTVLGA